MSKYTTEVRFICETAAGYDESKGYKDVDAIIESAIPYVFDFAFPIFDEEYRNVLCTKILRHYYTREIGLETTGLWKLKLQTKLNEIMPYYNQLYKSELIKFNPMYDTDISTTRIGDFQGEKTNSSNISGESTTNDESLETGNRKANENVGNIENRTGTSKSDGYSSGIKNSNEQSSRNENDTVVEGEDKHHTDAYSDTPQGALTGVLNNEYLTNARKIDDENNKNTNRNANASNSTNTNDTTSNSENIRNNYSEENTNARVTNGETEESKSRIGNLNKVDSQEISGNETFNNTESYAIHVIGKQSGISFSKMLKEFRDTFLNIDMEVINSLSGLFFNLW